VATTDVVLVVGAAAVELPVPDVVAVVGTITTSVGIVAVEGRELA